MDKPVKKTFSFRAECAIDLVKFIVAVDAAEDYEAEQPPLGLFITHVHTREPYNEPHVEIATYQPVSLEQVRNIVRTIEDGHVILQTLREVPLVENSLERDYTLE